MAKLKTIKRRTMGEGRRSTRTMGTKGISITKKKKIAQTPKTAEAKMVGPNLVESLPAEIIEEVLARVASSSVADLSRCKLSCKALDRIGREKYVVRNVGIHELEKSPLFCYNRVHQDAALSFFQRCIDCNNPEALFQHGMVQYFSQVNLEEGVKNFERAANLGNKMAAYVLGLILLCCGSDTERHKGVNLISDAKACNGKRIVEYRIRLQEFLCKIWMNNLLLSGCKPVSLAKGQQHVQCRRRCPWRRSLYMLEDEDDAFFCEACTCDYEVEFFLSLFPRST